MCDSRRAPGNDQAAARSRMLAGLPVQERRLRIAGVHTGMAARFASQHADQLRRLVLYAVPAIGNHRWPLRFVLAATRFDLRPSERNAERLDRWFLHDLDATRRRNRTGMRPSTRTGGSGPRSPT